MKSGQIYSVGTILHVEKFAGFTTRNNCTRTGKSLRTSGVSSATLTFPIFQCIFSRTMFGFQAFVVPIRHFSRRRLILLCSIFTVKLLDSVTIIRFICMPITKAFDAFPECSTSWEEYELSRKHSPAVAKS